MNRRCSFQTASTSSGMLTSSSVIDGGKPVLYSISMLTPVKPPLMRPFGLYRPLMAAHCTVTITRMVASVSSSDRQFQRGLACPGFCAFSWGATPQLAAGALGLLCCIFI